MPREQTPKPAHDPPEIARRLRAAIAYRQGATQKTVAKACQVSVRKVARWVDEDDDKTPPDHTLWHIADVLRIPRAWWYADIDRLAEIAPGLPIDPEVSRAGRTRDAFEGVPADSPPSRGEQPEAGASKPNREADG